jgi:hypothetical protein
MFSIYQFSRLRKDVQLCLLQHDGVHLELFVATHESEKALFRIYDFYVEVEICQRSGTCTQISSFRTPERLNKYLQQIDISEIQSLLSV